MFGIFLGLLIAPFAITLIHVLWFAYIRIFTNRREGKWSEYLFGPLLSWYSLLMFGLAAAIFAFFSFLPYNQSNFDRELVNAYNDNIELYERYSNEYAESARKQIEEYQRLQSELARNATVQQLQFYSQQQDDVGNALTDRIQFYQNEIMETELMIHKAEALIRARENNKWYFWVKDEV